MLCHLIDIFASADLKYHFCLIIIPLKIAFTVFYKYYLDSMSSVKIKVLRANKTCPYVVKMKLPKSKVKCDWIKLFNTRKKFQIY